MTLLSFAFNFVLILLSFAFKLLLTAFIYFIWLVGYLALINALSLKVIKNFNINKFFMIFFFTLVLAPIGVMLLPVVYSFVMYQEQIYPQLSYRTESLVFTALYCYFAFIRIISLFESEESK